MSANACVGIEGGALFSRATVGRKTPVSLYYTKSLEKRTESNRCLDLHYSLKNLSTMSDPLVKLPKKRTLAKSYLILTLTKKIGKKRKS